MLSALIAVRRIAVSGAERLYPKGIDWTLSPGVNALIGGTALGKTTLVYALQFAVFGKMVVEANERIEREFFSGRLSNRTEKQLEKDPPTVEVHFNAGDTAYQIRRNLLSGKIMSVSRNGEDIKANNYEIHLAQDVGLAKDFASLVRIQGHLLFFGESRYLLAWQNQEQHELLNLLMSDHAVYVRLSELWQRAESTDSLARNLSFQAVRLERELESASATRSKVTELARRSEGSRLTARRQEIERTVHASQQQLASEDENLRVLGGRIAQAQAEFHRVLTELETSDAEDLDSDLIAAALADPTTASVRHSIEEFYRFPRARACPCCGRPGIPESVVEWLHAAAIRVAEGGCVICSKDLPQPRQPEHVSESGEVTNRRARTLQSLIFEREQIRNRMSEIRKSLGDSMEALIVARANEYEYVRANPRSDDTLAVAIKKLREKENDAKDERDEHVRRLKRELTKTNAVFQKIQSSIVKAFKKYASLYLDEPCDVVFLKEGELPGKRGPQIKPPHAAFYPKISGETRPSAQDLSDAQRSFVDLAFRMAVVEVWHEHTKQPVTMIIETPEGAVDLAFMRRVGKMIRTFGEQGHILIITTNLNNRVFLPEIMSGWPKAERTMHIVNLLELGKPRPVQEKEDPAFSQILREVLAARKQ